MSETKTLNEMYGTVWPPRRSYADAACLPLPSAPQQQFYLSDIDPLNPYRRR